MRIRGVAIAGLSAVLLTACGGGTVEGVAQGPASASTSASPSAPSGPDLAAQAGDALEKAGSVRMQGDLSVGGEEIGLDLGLAGDDVAGTMTFNGQTVQLTVVGGVGYLNAPADFWASEGVPEPTASQLAASWVKAPASATAELNQITFADLVAVLSHPTDVTYDDEVGTGTLNGQPVWLVTDSEGSTTQIAAQGTPYPLQVAISGTDRGKVTLSEFGAVPPITAPADFVDLGG
jgi:hypothetical protein